MKYIVWALYDDGVGSWHNCGYDSNEFEIISIGINDNNWYNYYKIDLRLSNFNLIKELKALPKPDIIVASPPCESWSGADCKARIYDTNLNVKNKKFYDEYNKTAHKVKQRDFFQKERNRLIGQDTIAATIKIIEHFKPKYWIIENPQSSYIWKWINKHFNLDLIKNLAYYSNYDNNFSKKPTYFSSNVKLNLKCKNVKCNTQHMNAGYDQRSSIPKQLLLDILEQLRGKENE